MSWSSIASRRASCGQALRPHFPTPSTSSLRLSTPCAITSTTRTFTTTPPTLESKSRRKARLTRKSHLEQKALLKVQLAQGQPDPVLGYAEGNDSLWENSALKRVLLDRNEVWGTTVNVLPDEKVGAAAAGGEPTTEGQEAAKEEGGEEPYLPKHFNFGLTSPDVTHLTQDLPLVSAQAVFAGQPATKFEQLAQTQFEDSVKLEQVKRDRLMRIVDLRNAGSKGIEVENRRRIVEAFGKKEGDTGSPEVQAAIMTARIHSLTSHLASQPRDVHNRRPLRALIHQRAKTLKYLRSLDVKRYEDCLARIGVEPRAVEGEVIVSKLGLRKLIRPTV